MGFISHLAARTYADGDCERGVSGTVSDGRECRHGERKLRLLDACSARCVEGSNDAASADDELAILRLF